MDPLIEHVANKLSARDWEHSGHVEPFDFYEDMADVAVRAVQSFEMSRSGDSGNEATI